MLSVEILAGLLAGGRGAPSLSPSAAEVAIHDALGAARARWRSGRDPALLRRQLIAIVGELDRLGGR